MPLANAVTPNTGPIINGTDVGWTEATAVGTIFAKGELGHVVIISHSD